MALDVLSVETQPDVLALASPRSILRRRVSDPRALLGSAGYALLLQVAHPTVAAGVADHSTYASDPWGRALRTADYVFLLTYGEPATVRRLAAQLRSMHREIRGRDTSGKPYSALEPAAYAWVHATIGESIVRAHRFLGTTFTRAEREEFWQDWLGLGELLGIRPADLPDSWSELRQYMATMMAEVIGNNDEVQRLHRDAMSVAGVSPVALIPDSFFALAGRPAGMLLRFLGIGLLPARLRERFEITWSPLHEAAFGLYCATSKASAPLLPRTIRQYGPVWLELRRGHRGPFGTPNRTFLDEGECSGDRRSQ